MTICWSWPRPSALTVVRTENGQELWTRSLAPARNFPPRDRRHAAADRPSQSHGPPSTSPTGSSVGVADLEFAPYCAGAWQHSSAGLALTLRWTLDRARQRGLLGAALCRQSSIHHGAPRRRARLARTATLRVCTFVTYAGAIHMRSEGQSHARSRRGVHSPRRSLYPLVNRSNAPLPTLRLHSSMTPS